MWVFAKKNLHSLFLLLCCCPRRIWRVGKDVERCFDWWNEGDSKDYLRRSWVVSLRDHLFLFHSPHPHTQRAHDESTIVWLEENPHEKLKHIKTQSTSRLRWKWTFTFIILSPLRTAPFFSWMGRKKMRLWSVHNSIRIDDGGFLSSFCIFSLSISVRCSLAPCKPLSFSIHTATLAFMQKLWAFFFIYWAAPLSGLYVLNSHPSSPPLSCSFVCFFFVLSDSLLTIIATLTRPTNQLSTLNFTLSRREALNEI